MIYRLTRTKIFAVLIGILLAPAARAEPPALDVAPYEKCLNGFINLQARFLQTDPQGRVFQGRIYLVRPGYMRIEYAKTADGKETLPLLLVADGSRMTHFDKELKEVTHYSFDATPAGFFLKDTMKLSGDVVVKRVSTQHHTTEIEVVKRDKPDEGTLTLVFSENPRQLRKWVIRDAYKQETTVTLEDVQYNVRINEKVFDIYYKDPNQLIVDVPLALDNTAPAGTE